MDNDPKVLPANFFYDDCLEESGMMSKSEQERVAVKAMKAYAKAHLEKATAKIIRACFDSKDPYKAYPLTNIK